MPTAPGCVSGRRRRGGPTYVVEHMEEGLEDWCRLEYRHMCSFIPSERLKFLRWPADVSPTQLLLEGADASAEDRLPATIPEGFEELARRAREGQEAAQGAAPALDAGSPATGSSTFGLFANQDRVCLLDMDAEEALEPGDVSKFDELVFGGILGNVITREDGSYGSDDRTSELRRLGFAHRRHLGPMQMTTDTAVLVCHMVLEEARPLAEIPFIDSPEISAAPGAEGTGGNEGGLASDCVEMEGFRYVARRGDEGDWHPVLPEGMRELLLSSADDDILDSL